MNEFSFRKSRSVAAAAIAAGCHLAVYGSLALSASLLDAMTQEGLLPVRVLGLGITAYVAAKILTSIMFCFQDWYRQHAEIAEFGRGWRHFFPERVTFSNRHRSEDLYNTLQHNLPALLSLRLDTVSKIASALVLAVVAGIQVYRDQFWIGALSGVAIVVLSYLAGFVMRKSFRTSMEHLNRDGSALIGWMQRYFSGYRDIAANISPIVGKKPKDLAEGTLKKRLALLRQVFRLGIRRDIVGIACVDLPPILSFAGLIWFGFQGYLTVGSIFLWFGLMDHFISMGVALRKVKDNSIECESILNVIRDQMQDLSAPSDKVEESSPEMLGETFHFTLNDGTDVHLSSRPGIYHIRGGNGSGKSLLINTLLKLNDHYDRWDTHAIKALSAQFDSRFRTIEEDPTVPGGASEDFTLDLAGQESASGVMRARLGENLRKYLADQSLRGAWLSHFDYLDRIYQERHGSLSKGEKAIFSMLRLFLSLDDRVCLIACDEIDSGLDVEKRKLFENTLQHLKSRYAIYFISHTTRVSWESLKCVPQTQVYLMGFNKTKAQGVVMGLSMNCVPGIGHMTASGSIGSDLLECGQKVLRALVAIQPKYRILLDFDFHLDLDDKNSHVGESRSAGLAIAVGLINLYRLCIGQTPATGVAATGDVFLNGLVNPTSHMDEKMTSARQSPWISAILTAQDIRHLSELETTLFQGGSHGADEKNFA